MRSIAGRIYVYTAYVFYQILSLTVLCPGDPVLSQLFFDRHRPKYMTKNGSRAKFSVCRG